LRAGGKATSALLAGLVLLGAASAAQAQASASQQVEQAVDGYFREALIREAARRSWQGARVSHDTRLPASAAHLAACAEAPTVRPLGDTASLTERQRLEVRCNAGPGWSLELTGQAQVLLPVVHASGVIDRGQTLAATDLRLEPINIGKAQRGYYNRLDEVTGKTAKRRIRPGQLLTPSLLSLPLAVRRGQPVKIVAHHDGIEASTAGEALVDGQPGDVIRVRNVRSGKVIEAKVIEEGVVTSTY
jgi:flagella basal body P-ring formation protein FlgA